MADQGWDSQQCPYCRREVVMGLMSLIATCRCGAAWTSERIAIEQVRSYEFIDGRAWYPPPRTIIIDASDCQQLRDQLVKLWQDRKCNFALNPEKSRLVYTVGAL